MEFHLPRKKSFSTDREQITRGSAKDQQSNGRFLNGEVESEPVL
jgi:hypothetical protein